MPVLPVCDSHEARTMPSLPVCVTVMRRILCPFSHGVREAWGAYYAHSPMVERHNEACLLPPYPRWYPGGHTTPWYTGYYTTLGTPNLPPAHSPRVYTEHARSRLTALEHRLAELTIPVTAVTVRVVTVRRCHCPSLFSYFWQKRLSWRLEVRRLCTTVRRLFVTMRNSDRQCWQCAHPRDTTEEQVAVHPQNSGVSPTNLTVSHILVTYEQQHSW